MSIVIFIHLKLELLTQFPASNDEKYFYLSKISSKFNYLTRASTINYIIHFSDVYLGLESVWNCIHGTHTFSNTEFKDFLRTFQGLLNIFQGAFLCML